MTDFLNFHQSLNADPAKRGKQFEHFVKWFLTNESEWATQVAQVWLWDEYPERWGIDCGIDLIFKHKNGELWAVQAKCYSADHDITKHDVDKFLSESSRSSISKRLLIATTDRIGANARQVCDAQEKPVVRYLLSNFESAEIDYPARFEDLYQAKLKARPTPHQHQVEAIAATAENFTVADRGQLIMACGTGKTFTTLWIKEKLDARTTLVLVPSLSLLSQTLKEWTFAATQPFDVLCVCSDQTVSKRGEDEIIHSVADLAFPVTSNVDEIRQFLQGEGDRVVFSTYQSSPLIAEAQTTVRAEPVEAHEVILPFDLVIADEAHRCAGKVGSDFATVLNGDLIKANKRLFATATPRTYATAIHKAAEERGVEVVGMDDAAVFGKVFYSLPFPKAIQRGLLTDYRVVIIGVDDPTIAEWIANRELLSLPKNATILSQTENLPHPQSLMELLAIRLGEHTTLAKSLVIPRREREAKPFSLRGKGGDGGKNLPPITEASIAIHDGGVETDAESLAVQIGLLKAIKDYDLKRVISFHSRVKRAEEFASDIQDVLGWVSEQHKPSGNLWTDFVSGAMPTNKRKQKLDRLKAISENQRGVLTNARCLSEGVDVPSLDGVAFIDPRSSQVDIVQAVGRAIRLSADKKYGTIILPVFIKQGADAAASIEASNFKPVWEILNALKSHDEELAFELDQLRTEMGRRSGTKIGADAFAKIAIDLPATVDASFGDSLRTYLVEQTTASWNFWFGLLEEYVEVNGNARVSRNFKTVDGFRLGIWVHHQRTLLDKISSERKARLESLPGWSWHTFDSDWEEGFSYLKKFVERKGHTRGLRHFKAEDGFRLGQWVSGQRLTKSTMSPERRSRLEALPGWSWEPFADMWEEGFSHLKKFADREGHISGLRYATEDGYQIGQWVGVQRRAKNKMTAERKARLESLPGWSWEPFSDQWEDGFRNLKEFADQEGHANAPTSFKTKDEYFLGQWVSGQRKIKNTMPSERKVLLEALSGWSWNPFDDAWEVGFRHLEEFSEREGHNKMSRKYISSDGYKLGVWVANQLSKREKISSERKARLEALTGWVWRVKSL